MKTRILAVVSAILILIMSVCGQASAYSSPPTWMPMEMLDITYDAGTNKLAITNTLGPAPLAYKAPGTFDPAAVWGMLNDTSVSRQFGWNDPGYDMVDPNTMLIASIRNVYGPSANIWIEAVSKSAGLNTYLAVGTFGVNANDSLTVDLSNPSGVPYSPIFGAAGSFTRWLWDGMMDHNTNAVPTSYLSGPNQTFSATYKIYVGDGLGNELLVDQSGNPVSSASTTTTWQWQGPAFVFASQTGVAVNTLIESDAFTVTGIASPQPISVTGGEYTTSTDGGITWGPWTATASAIALNDKVKVRQTSATGPSTTTTVALSIGGIAGPGSFNVTTVDGVPDPFSFTSLTGVDAGTAYESNAIAVTGIDTSVSISIAGTGAKYAVSTDNGTTWGAWTSSVGTIALGNQVKLQLTSSAAANTAATATLTIGGVAGAFTITTNPFIAPPTWMPMTMLNITLNSGVLAIVDLSTKSPFNTVPPTYPVLSAVATASTFDPGKPWAVLNGTAYSRRLGWNPGTGLNAAAIQAAFGANASIWIEKISSSPGLQTFQAVGSYGVNANNTTTVDPAANGYAPIFGTSGSSTKWKWDYKMDHNANAVPAAYITTPNQYFNATYRIYIGDSVTGDDIAPAAASTTTWGWTGPAAVPDNVPDPFSFTAQTGTALSTVVESNAITVTGLAVPAMITITGGECSLSSDGGASWSAYSATSPATIANGNLVKVRQTSSSVQGVTTTATLIIGGVSGTFSVTTQNAITVVLTPHLASPQPPGTPITITASVQGGSGTYEYRFWLYNGSSWTMVQDYGVGTSWILPAGTPAGNYTVAADCSSNPNVYRDTVAYLGFEIALPPANSVTITPDQPTPHPASSQVVFTASVGAPGYQYRFWLFDGVSWTMVQDYGIGSTWTMPASTPINDYVVAVDARSSSAVSRDTVAYLSYQVTPASATGVTITPDIPSPHAAPVVFTAAGQGSSGYHYRFWLYTAATASWALAQDYGNGGNPDSTWQMPLGTTAGDYVIAVDVRTNSGMYRDAVAYLPYTIP